MIQNILLQNIFSLVCEESALKYFQKYSISNSKMIMIVGKNNDSC
ncbi:uncharacterized protein METZ01_LOCUS40742 [marine metagenome]|uniref:Uncharacterized protein n=1 Tax=marine metagenome TaxID=408172 RepID=A0A381RAC0_9ZZZZ